MFLCNVYPDLELSPSKGHSNFPLVRALIQGKHLYIETLQRAPRRLLWMPWVISRPVYHINFSFVLALYFPELCAQNHRHITWVGFEPPTFSNLEQCLTNFIPEENFCLCTVLAACTSLNPFTNHDATVFIFHFPFFLRQQRECPRCTILALVVNTMQW